MVANDGIFFFPAKSFNSIFKTMSVSYYNENWKVSSYFNPVKENPSQSSPLTLTLDNPRTQDVVLSFEHTPEKSLPPNTNCREPDSNDGSTFGNYNVIVTKKG